MEADLNVILNVETRVLKVIATFVGSSVSPSCSACEDKRMSVTRMMSRRSKASALSLWNVHVPMLRMNNRRPILLKTVRG